MSDQFAVAEESLTALAGNESRLFEPFLGVLPVDGLSISTFGDFLPAETVSASDALSFRLDELQIDLGEGPCWDALETGAPVLEPMRTENSAKVDTRVSHDLVGVAQSIRSVQFFGKLVGAFLASTRDGDKFEPPQSSRPDHLVQGRGMTSGGPQSLVAPAGAVVLLLLFFVRTTSRREFANIWERVLLGGPSVEGGMELYV